MKVLKPDQPVLFVIGPSGTGKSTVLRELTKRGVIELTASWTTRPKRTDETSSSIEHEFISDSKFDKLEENGFFIEVFKLFNLPYRFGLPKIKQPTKGKIPTVVLRTYLVPLMQKHYSNSLVYALEDDFLKVEKRLHGRLATGEPLGSRLKEYNQELVTGKRLAKRVFRNASTIEILANEIQEAIAKDFTYDIIKPL